MTHFKQQRRRPFLFGAIALVCMSAWGGTADAAEYTRHCRAVLIVTPVEPDASEVVISFEAHVTVPLRMMVNDARRNARQWIVRCIQEHWAARDELQSPENCRFTTSSYPDYPVFLDYPFNNLTADLSQALCRVNPDALALNADVLLQIRGKRGCIRGSGTGVDPHEEHLIADDARFWCSERPGEGSGFENVEPEIGEGSGFENVDPAHPEPPLPEPPVLPPEAEPEVTFRVLPNIRLPGSDLGFIDVADGDWQACQQACADNDDCRAWTYRNRFRGIISVCLLKRGAGLPIPDTCCRSGIRE